ncbi:MAG TPA: DUF427 domain-containing protein [Candidatus Saccharimonadales bacterium]|nr:DUF427 domain-containing protein [Candidatus Saccharimonadales bacterium]
MKAIWNNTVLAEAPKEKLIRIEGNWYFPQNSLKKENFKLSDHKTTCFWKGEASYYDVMAGGQTNDFGAWYYHQPMAGSIERVGKDFTDYVAFWNGIQVED